MRTAPTTVASATQPRTSPAIENSTKQTVAVQSSEAEPPDAGAGEFPCNRFRRWCCESEPCDPDFQNRDEICLSDVGRPTCRCENGACRANLDRRASFDLVVTETGLDGIFEGGAQMRLRRVQ